MQPKHYVTIAIGIGLAVGIVAWLALAPKQAVAPSSIATSSNVTVESTGGQAIVGEVSTAPKPPSVPPLVFSAALPSDAKAALQTQYNTLSSQLKTMPTRVDLWLELGVVYKIAGDYNGAIVAWTYVAQGGATNNYVAYGDLGDLYLNFTHDYAKAAAAYTQALKGAPKNPDYQAGLKAAQSHL